MYCEPMKITTFLHNGKRKYQEDSIFSHEEPDGSVIAVVADGLGGHPEGAFASLVTTLAFKSHIPRQPDESIPEWFSACIAAADDACKQKTDEIKSWYRPVGSTCVAMYYDAPTKTCHTITVGDSFVFIKINDVWNQISVADEHLGGLTNCIGDCHGTRYRFDENVQAILLASDGVEELIDRGRLMKVIDKDAEQIGEAVLELEDKHQDNISIIKVVI